MTEGPFAHLEFSQWILAELAALFLGLSKTSFSAISLLGIALMAQILPARESTGIILPMLVLGDVLAVGSFLRHTRWSEVFRLLPALTLGILVGVLLFRVIPPPLFGRIIGIAVVLLTALQVCATPFASQRTARAKANRGKRSERTRGHGSRPLGPLESWQASRPCWPTRRDRC